MKKILMIALALGLAVALAAPAMATDWSARGWIGVTGAVHQSVGTAGGPQINQPPWPTTVGGDSWIDVLGFLSKEAGGRIPGACG